MKRTRRVSPTQITLFIMTLISVVGLALIFFFVIREGFPIFTKVGLGKFLLGREWLPTRGSFGALPLIQGSLIIVIGSVLLATPLGVGLAIFMVEYAPRPVRQFLKTIVELLAGIPSVIFGFFGITVFIPLTRQYFGGPSGFGLIPAIVVLSIMIIPTITAVSADAIRAVPRENRLIVLALGGTRWQTIRRGVLPSAFRGIVTGTILAVGRAIGETMAVSMVIGNAPQLVKTLNQPAAAMPSQIALDMAYASGDHRTALFALAAVLLVFASILILAARRVGRRTR
jgi:phosphate transport system permease protein